MNRYFQKELPHNAILDGKGRRISFDVISDSIGITVLNPDDPNEFDSIEALQTLAANRKGGVTEISEEEFSELKKKPNLTPSKRRQRESVVRPHQPPSPYRRPQSVDPVAETKKTEPKSSAQDVVQQPEDQPTSVVETEAAPWDASPEAPRTAQVKD